ncbi:MAG: TspO/MBR family protein [Planctomycetota bacterium]|nr:TspO/MBR family protein [Planctomycetota bacterium]
MQALRPLVLWVLLSFVPSLTGIFFRPGAWYAALEKPAWTPPGWVFGPVWTTLYTLMGIAAWLVWRKAGWSGARTALSLFLVQLALNAAWTPLFFGVHAMLVAFVCIVLMWLAVAATLVAFWRQTRLAGVLLVPYLAWLTLASALNFELWRLNP